MRENYFDKLIEYIKNVYQFDKQIEHVTDERVNPKYKTTQIVSIVLTGLLLGIQSFNQLKFMILSGEFNNFGISISGISAIDSIRNCLKKVNFNALRNINEKNIVFVHFK